MIIDTCNMKYGRGMYNKCTCMYDKKCRLCTVIARITDTYNNTLLPGWTKKIGCYNESHPELCDNCRLRFECYTCEPKHDYRFNKAEWDIKIKLSDILKVNKNHKNYLEARFMLEEYMFGHMLNLTDSAKIDIG